MIGLGMTFLGLTLFASFLRWRGKLYETRWLLKIFVPVVILPILANEVGWIAAEVGRQPWIVHPPVAWNAEGTDVVTGAAGVHVYDEKQGLRTTDAVSPNVRGGQVLGSLIAFTLIYLTLMAVWMIILDRKIKAGPGEVPPENATDRDGGEA